MKNHPTRSLAVAVFVSTLAAAAPAQIDRITGRSFTTRSEVLAQHGMVCTSQPLATKIGVDVLKAGGSAVDDWFELQFTGRCPAPCR